MSIFTPFKFRYDLYKDGAPTRRTYSVSYAQQFAEAWHLFKLNQLEPYEYNDNHLSDPKLTLADKERFLSYNQACVLNAQLNPLYARGILLKFVFSQFMGTYGIPTPRSYGLFDPDFGYTPQREPFRTVDDLRRVIEKNNLSEFVIKPAGGAKGTGITVITGRKGDLFLSGDEREYSYADLWKLMLDGFNKGLPHHRDCILMQERIRQHPALEAIHPGCTNTIRLMTFVTQAGEIEIIGRIIKFGRGKTMVDNVDKGAMMAAISSSGLIGPLVKYSPERLEYIDRHPDTNAQIAGLQLPFFTEAMALAREAQLRLPQLRSLGFDIAITPTGPVIIEGNAWWGILPQTITREGFITEGMREVLNQIM